MRNGAAGVVPRARGRHSPDAGPFDEQLGAGGRFASSEDTDMFYRVLRCGWVVMCRDEPLADILA